MLLKPNVKISKLEIAKSNVPAEALEHIYKQDVLKLVLKEIESKIDIEIIDTLEDNDIYTIYAEACLLNKDELHKIFDLLERLKTASNQIPAHLIREIKDILV
ncbi:MAG TPA: hypothetical protein VJ881_08310 [Halanaerobiales bacterium]|nr:hypothetical protein [Halanaerobiales bacterium]